MAKVNLDKLHNEIEQRKKEQMKTFGVNEGSGFTGGQPKDAFLHKLLTSLDSGVESESTQKLKMVENLVAEKAGEKPVHRVKNVQPKRQIPTPEPLDEDMDREDLLWENLQKGRSSTLAGSIESFSGNQQPNWGQYPQYQHPQYQQQPNYQQPINEGHIVNLVENIIGKYIGENFSRVIEDSIKGVVFDMYASERIKEALEENRDILKKEILLTLKELSQKKKK